MVPTDIANCVLWLHSDAGLFKDTGKTTPVSADADSVACWADQSGNGNDCIQATALNQPKWDQVKALVQFEIGNHGAGTGNEWLNLPSGFSTNSQSFSFFAIAELVTTRADFLYPSTFPTYQFIFETATSASLLFENSDGILDLFDGSAFKNGAQVPPTSRALLGFTAGATGANIIINGTTQAVAALGAATATGGAIFSNSAEADPAQAAVKHVIAYSRQLTGTEVTQLQAWAATQGAILTPVANAAIDGDSIAYGFCSTLNRTWARQLPSLANCVVTNRSLAGVTIATLSSQAGTFIDPLIQAGKTNVLIVAAGTNDLQNGTTAAALYASYQSYCAARKTAGWNKIIIVGILPRTDVDIEAARQAVRTSLLGDFTVSTGKSLVYGPGTGITYADAYVDLASDPTMGTTADTTNTTYYADLAHPTSAGYAIVAPYIDGAASLFVPTGGGMPSSFKSTVQADTPQNWYRLADLPGTAIVKDSAGSANGSYAGSTTPIRVGPLTNDSSSACQFDNATASANLGNPAALQFSTNFSFEGLFQTNLSDTNPHIIVNKTNAFALFINNHTLQYFDYGGNGGAGLSKDTGVTVDDGLWHHFIVTISGTTLTVYLDGTAHAFTVVGAVDQLENCIIGAGGVLGDRQFFSGNISEIIFYNSVLSSSRATAHYNATGLSGGYTVLAPMRAPVGVPATISVTIKTTSTTTITLSDNAAGGTFGSTTLAFTNGGATTLTTTYTPAAAGTITLTTTNNNSLADPQGNTLVAFALTTGTTVTASSNWIGVAGTGWGNSGLTPFIAPARGVGQVALQFGEVPYQDISGRWTLPIYAFCLDATETTDAVNAVEVYCEGNGVKVTSRSLHTFASSPISNTASTKGWAFLVTIETTALSMDGDLMIYARATSSNGSIASNIKSIQVSANNLGTRSSTTFYVNASTGNDANSGTSGSPKATIDGARNAIYGAQAGDVGGGNILLQTGPHTYGAATENTAFPCLDRWLKIGVDPNFTASAAKINAYGGSTDGIRTEKVRIDGVFLDQSTAGSLPSVTNVLGRSTMFWGSGGIEFLGAGQLAAGNPTPLANVFTGGIWFTDAKAHDMGSAWSFAVLSRNCLAYNLSGVANPHVQFILGGEAHNVDDTGTLNHADVALYFPGDNGFIAYGFYSHDCGATRLFGFNSPTGTINDFFAINCDISTGSNQDFDFGEAPTGMSHIGIWECTIPTDRLLMDGGATFAQDRVSIRRNVIHNATEQNFTSSTNTTITTNWFVTGSIGTALGTGTPQYNTSRIPQSGGNLVVGAGAPIIAYDRLGNTRNAITSAVGAYETGGGGSGGGLRGRSLPSVIGGKRLRGRDLP